MVPFRRDGHGHRPPCGIFQCDGRGDRGGPHARPGGRVRTRAFNLPLPAADATAANYFLARGVHIAALDDDTAHAVAQAMADAVAGGQDVFALYIEEGLDFADTVEKLFQGGSYFLGDCVQRANTALDGEEQIDYAAIRYVPCESQRGVSVRLR